MGVVAWSGGCHLDRTCWCRVVLGVIFGGFGRSWSVFCSAVVSFRDGFVPVYGF